jgi:hypothetical protein
MHANLEMHQGQALRHLSNKYPELREVIHELVQNSLDANAKRIEISVNKKTRIFSVRDDGHGLDAEGFVRAISSVANSSKRSDKLGRFGLGLMSPLAKCRSFSFTSCAAKGDGQYNEWDFQSQSIIDSRTNPTIPLRKRSDLRHGQNGIWWRSQVQVMRYTQDKFISELEVNDLRRSILDKYSPAMTKSHTKVTIRMTDEDGKEQKPITFAGGSYAGTPIQETIITNAEGGKTTFRLYQVRASQRRETTRINIHMGEASNNFRIIFASFLRSIQRGSSIMDEDILNVYRSGVFEGEILSERATINVQRSGFELNDACIFGLCSAMHEWAEKHGKKYVMDAKQASRDDRFQRTAITAMSNVERLLSDVDIKCVQNWLYDQSGIGSVGVGHALPNNRTLGNETTAVAARGGAFKERGPNNRNGSGGGSHEPANKERKSHLPFLVEGVRGKKRHEVKSNSLGLVVAHDDIDGSDDIWQYDPQYRRITFNITHPCWAMCEGSDEKLALLQQQVILAVVSTESICDETTRSLLSAKDKVSIRLYANGLSAGHLAVRQPYGRKPKAKVAKKAKAG